MSADPSGFVTSPPSTYVKIINTARAEMNGQFGLVFAYNEERSRYILVLTKTGAQAMLRPENLEPCSSMEKYQAQYEQLRNDPRVKQKINELYGKAQQLLGGRKPEHAAGVLGLLLLFATYQIGFSKMIMLTSLIMLLGIVVAPDIQAFGIRRWKLIMRNFPTRCRETIEQTIPQARGRVSNQMALGLVLAMIAFAGRTLMIPTSPPPRPAPPSYDTPPMDTIQRSLSASNAVEEAYKLGFNDATANLPFGSASLAALKQQVPVVPEIEYDRLPTPPPPPKSGGGFGFSTLMSLFVVGRTCFQSGMTADGNFDPQLLMANLQLMPLPQKALLGFSVFNVLRSFL